LSARPPDHSLSTRVVAGIAAVVAALFVALGAANPWQMLELKGFDALTVATSPDASNLPITVIGIDEDSMNQIGRQWPWPREIYAKLLKVLRDQGATVVVFDVLFPEPDARGPEQDEAFAREIKASGNVLMAADRRYIETEYSRTSMRVDPLPLFKEAGALTGFARIELDPDVVARRIPREDDALWRQTARMLKQRVQGLDYREPPADAMIRYAGPFRTFQYVPFYAALDPALLPPGALKDQVVIVCRYLEASPDVGAAQSDLFLTPFSGRTQLFTPGGEIHANILETVIGGHAIQPLGFAWHLLLVLGACVLGAWGMRRWRPLPSAAVAIALVVPIVALDWALFRYLNMWLAAGAAVAAVTTLYLTYGAIGYLVEAQRRAELRRAFSLYVSPEVVDHVMAHPERLSLGGERRDVTMMFTDLAGFTTITEQQGAEQVTRILNMHFSRGTAIVKRHNGTVNRFIGDAIMAMWGAPLDDAQQARHAVLAAIDMQEDMVKLRDELAQQGLPPIWMRIGVHSCNAIIGNLGSAERFDYTAIGDGVNLAARMEGVNKLYGTGILLSGETAAQLGEGLPVRVVDRVIVKGKSEPVDLFTPCADLEVVEWSARGMAAYRERRWGESEELWRRVRERMPRDRVAEIHLERLAALKVMPATTQWQDAVELEKL
jgi:adenylate cyclase